MKKQRKIPVSFRIKEILLQKLGAEAEEMGLPRTNLLEVILTKRYQKDKK